MISDGPPRNGDPKSVAAEREETSSAATRFAPSSPGSPALFDEFLAEPSVLESLRLWLGPAGLSEERSVREVIRRLAGDVAAIDDKVSAQVNAILHHPRFQALEASWRGVEQLVEEVDAADESSRVRIELLDASWKEIARDAERAVEFDQSELFRKIYGECFDTPGGEPFSLLIGDYEIRPRPEPGGADDLTTLESIAGVAAAAFAPFVAAAHPSFFGVESFTRLERPMNVRGIFDSPVYTRWRSLRERDDARFVGLTVPKLLLRRPYGDDTQRTEGFSFREEVAGPGSAPDAYLWGNAAYAFASVVIRAFIRSGWLADIRGFDRGEKRGGLVYGFPCDEYGTDSPGIAPKGSTDLFVDEVLEGELSELGFMPLCSLPGTPVSVFYANASVQKPLVYDTAEATTNARMSAMLQYTLCVSRFAHHLKIIVRDKTGSFDELRELEDLLHRWLYRHVTPDALASDEMKAKYPLRDARIRLFPKPGAPGSYLCEMLLVPHYQLDAVAAAVTLRTELRTVET